MSILLELIPVFMWLLWVAIVITLIKVDQRRRAAAAAAAELARPDDVDVTSFEDKSVTPYLALSCLFGALVLPVYFVATRKTVKGAIIGVCWTVLTMLFVSGVTVALTAVLAGPAKRADVQASVSSCMDSSNDRESWQCERAGSAYVKGEVVDKDIVRAAELFDRGCVRGDISACVRLMDLRAFPEVPPEKIEAARAEGARQCARARQADKGKLPGMASISDACDRFPDEQAGISLN